MPTVRLTVSPKSSCLLQGEHQIGCVVIIHMSIIVARLSYEKRLNTFSPDLSSTVDPT
jgi:hypothetical protein